MKTVILKAAATLALAAALPGCASLAGVSSADLDGETAGRIHAGLTPDEVRAVAGNPDMNFKSGDGSELWIYSFQDLWGHASELDVTFDKGVVTDTHAERNH